jgi:hypothetical protein
MPKPAPALPPAVATPGVHPAAPAFAPPPSSAAAQHEQPPPSFIALGPYNRAKSWDDDELPSEGGSASAVGAAV